VTLDAGLWHNFELSSEIDLSLQFDESKHADHVITRMATYHYALFASPDYVRLYGAPRTLAEVADHRVIHHVAQRHQPETWRPKAAALQMLWSSQIETNSSAVAMIAARAGAGIAALPTMALSFAPELVMIGDEPMAKLTLWLVHHAEAAKTERVRRVMDWLKRIFDNRANPWFREEYIPPDEFLPQVVAEAANAEPAASAPPSKVLRVGGAG
jgi:DNA-binding transcriptional LysR family regulator